MTSRPGRLAAVLLAFVTAVPASAGCTSSQPTVPAVPDREIVESPDPTADLCRRIDYPIAAGVFGEPASTPPEEDAIGSTRRCRQTYQGLADGIGPGGLVEVRTIAFDAPEAARRAFDGSTVPAAPTPFPAGSAIRADAVRYQWVGPVAAVEILDGRLAIEVRLTPPVDLDKPADLDVPTDRLSEATARLGADVLRLLRSA